MEKLSICEEKLCSDIHSLTFLSFHTQAHLEIHAVLKIKTEFSHEKQEHAISGCGFCLFVHLTYFRLEMLFISQ